MVGEVGVVHDLLRSPRDEQWRLGQYHVVAVVVAVVVAAMDAAAVVDERVSRTLLAHALHHRDFPVESLLAGRDVSYLPSVDPTFGSEYQTGKESLPASPEDDRCSLPPP